MLIGLVLLREVNVSAVCNLIERRGHPSWIISIQYFCYKKKGERGKNTFVQPNLTVRTENFKKNTALNVFEAEK